MHDRLFELVVPLVIAEAFVDVAELARGVADHVRHPRLLLLLDAREKIECLSEMAFVGERHRFCIEILVGQPSGMAVDARLSLVAPDKSSAAADFDASFLRGAVFVAGRTFSLGCLGRLSIPALRIGKRTAGDGAKAEQQKEGAKPQ